MTYVLCGVIFTLVLVIGFLIYCINSAAGAVVKTIESLGRNR
jgi:hypothetical protein